MSSTPPASSNTRSTRSRFSSPQVSTNGASDSSSRTKGGGNGGGASGTERQKTLDQWLEPAVQVKASYEEAGFVRHPLFKEMAPLGTMPKAGVPKAGIFKNTAPTPTKAPEQQPAPVRKIVLKQKKPAVPPPAPVEDETEGDETEEQDSSSTEELQDEEEYDEVAKQTATKNDTKTRTTAATQRQRRSIASEETDDEDWAPAAPAQKGARRRSLSRASSQRLQQRAGSASEGHPQTDRKAFIGKVVEVAVDEALSHFRYPTAWALRTLYDENSANEDFLDMIEKVFLQTANADILEAFARLVQSRKKEGRKKDQAYDYFVPPSNNSRAVQPPPPKRAPYGSLVKFDLAGLRPDRGGRKPQKPSRPVKASEPEPEAEPARETNPEAEGAPSRKKRKLRRQHSGTSSSSSKMTGTDGASSKATTETVSRRRTRARSESSTSSLSSARSLSPPEGIEADAEGEEFEDAPSRNSPVPAQPITATRRRRSNAPRKGRNVSLSRPLSSSAASTPAPQLQANAAAPSQQTAPSQRQPRADELPSPESDVEQYEMPAVVDSPLFPNLSTKRGGKSHAGTPVPVPSSAVGRLDPADPKVRLRENARKVTNKPLATSNVRESFRQTELQRVHAEGPVTPVPAATAVASSRPRASLPPGRQTPAPREGRSTRSALKRTHEDLDEQTSPTAAHFPGSEAASTAADSRAGTPALRTAKRPRTGLRVKNSPVKKKNGAAGIPRPSGERSSPVGNGIAGQQDDNDDYCSACGGNGQLICCDGCTRSFHFLCADPVLMQDAMPVEWFCNVCRANRDPAAIPVHTGAFSLLQEKLDIRNSSAFCLPPSIRDLFDGVRTGADGEYEEIVAPVKPNRKRKNEEEQVPDLFRVRDAEGNAVICHACQKGSSSDRAIIPCSSCGLFWHLDCLDPPLAIPPVLRTWKCPLHADEILPKLVALGPAHKHRKLRNAPIVRPAFSRGYVNNGYIDVQLDDSDDESGWRDLETFGRTVRLPEKGIKLDFLSRARGNGVARPIPSQNATALTAPTPIEQRSLEEQQAALNLVQLGRGQDEGISTLVDALIAQADPTVIDLMARIDPNRLEHSRLNHMDLQALRAVLASTESMAEHIRRLLSSATGSGALEFDGAKSPASPATTDDVPAMTQGEKTPAQGDQSPAAPLPLEGTAPIANGSLPVLPTKTSSIPVDEPVVVEANGDGEKALGEGPDGAPLELE